MDAKAILLSVAVVTAGVGALPEAAGAQNQPAQKGSWQEDVVSGALNRERDLSRADACNVSFSNAVRVLANTSGIPNTSCAAIDKTVEDFIKGKVREAVSLVDGACPGLLDAKRRGVLENDTRLYWSGKANETDPLRAIFGGTAPMAGKRGSASDCGHAKRYLDGDEVLRRSYRVDPFNQKL